MRILVFASLVLGAASLGGCIQADIDDEESVEAAEQPIFVDPPMPHGFLFVTDQRVRIPIRPAATIGVGLGFVAATTAGGDDGDGDDPQ